MKKLYLAHLTGSPFYKIGISDHPLLRFDGFDQGLPYELSVKILRVWEVSDALDLEQELLAYFKPIRVRGEWVRPDQPDDFVREVEAYVRIVCIDSGMSGQFDVGPWARVLEDSEPSSYRRHYFCPHCELELANRQQLSSAKAKGYCLACKPQ